MRKSGYIKCFILQSFLYWVSFFFTL